MCSEEEIEHLIKKKTNWKRTELKKKNKKGRKEKKTRKKISKCGMKQQI